MTFFLMLMQMLPGIVGLIKQVETIIPGQGQGPARLNVLLNTVNAAAASAPEVAAAIGNHDLNAAVATIANATVNTLNAAGVFPHAGQPAATQT
jgi:hypothetical protein